jgi:hypothetical protein
MTNNPFEVLRLSPEVSEEDAVKQATRLCQLAATETERNAIRQAIQQLIASREAWTLQALLTPPRPQYQHAEIDRFVAAHRRPPAGVTMPVSEEKREEPKEEPIARRAILESAEEITRQTNEAVWWNLVGEPQA